MYRDIIIGLTSKGLFVLASEKRMIFPGMDAIVGANGTISLSLMPLGGKLHWGSIEIGLVCQPGICLFPQLILNRIAIKMSIPLHLLAHGITPWSFVSL